MNASHSWSLARSFGTPELPTEGFSSILNQGHYLTAKSSRRDGGADGMPSKLAEGQSGSRLSLSGRRALPHSLVWALSRQRNTKRSGLNSQAALMSRIGYRMPRSQSGLLL
jgi:hypothetical protein